MVFVLYSFIYYCFTHPRGLHRDRRPTNPFRLSDALVLLVPPERFNRAHHSENHFRIFAQLLSGCFVGTILAHTTITNQSIHVFAKPHKKQHEQSLVETIKRAPQRYRKGANPKAGSWSVKCQSSMCILTGNMLKHNVSVRCRDAETVSSLAELVSEYMIDVCPMERSTDR